MISPSRIPPKKWTSSFGTTLPDILMPGFASMVHGRLKGPPMEVSNCGGICSAGIMAFKNAYMAIKTGEHSAALAGASELASSTVLKSSRFESEVGVDRSLDDLDVSYQYFNADFLRWMLSDGAGAVVLEDRPRGKGVSLRVDWVDITSFANEYDTCMYMGTNSPKNLKPGSTWLSVDNYKTADELGMLVVRQDTKLLAKGIGEIITKEFKICKKKYELDANKIDIFLPHISSYYFVDTLERATKNAECYINKDKWFTNLDRVGNVGSASIYLMLEEAMNQSKIKPGDKILLMVPESGRFILSLTHLTCVESK